MKTTIIITLTLCFLAMFFFMALALVRSGKCEDEIDVIDRYERHGSDPPEAE